MDYLFEEKKDLFIDSIKTTNSMSLNQYINKICIENLSTVEGRREAVKKVFGFKQRIPIYINNKCILFPTKSPRNNKCIWINYSNISFYCTYLNKVLVYFKSCNNILIEMKYQAFNKMIKRIREIENYLKR